MTTAAELDDRYGRTARPGARRVWWIALAVVAAGAIGLLSWSTVASSMYSVSVDDLGFEVKDPHTVSVRFQFAAQPDQDVTCVLDALDTAHGSVGYRVITYPAGASHQQQFTEDIRTVAEATTGLVQGCWVS